MDALVLLTEAVKRGTKTKYWQMMCGTSNQQPLYILTNSRIFLANIY